MPSNAETGLQPNEEREHVLFVGPGPNLSWPVSDKNISYEIPSGELLAFRIIFTQNSRNFRNLVAVLRLLERAATYFISIG